MFVFFSMGSVAGNIDRRRLRPRSEQFEASKELVTAHGSFSSLQYSFRVIKALLAPCERETLLRYRAAQHLFKPRAWKIHLSMFFERRSVSSQHSGVVA